MRKFFFFPTGKTLLLCFGLFMCRTIYGQSGPSSNVYINYTTANGLGSNSVNAVLTFGTNILAATDGGLSISTNGTTFSNLTTANGLPSNKVKDVFVSGTTIYAATDAGLAKSTNGGASFSTVTTLNGLGSNIVNRVLAASNNVLVATANGVGISVNGGTAFFNATKGLGSPYVNSVYGNTNYILAGTNGGLALTQDSGKNFSNITKANAGLANDTVYGVFISPDTITYASTKGGLSVLPYLGSFTNYGKNEGLGSDTVYNVYKMGNTIYVATAGGLSISTDGGQTYANYTKTNGLGSNVVRNVYANSVGIYAATSNGLSVSACTTPTVFNVSGGGTLSCTGGSTVSFGLSGSQSGTNYLPYLNGSGTGIVATGSGSSLSFSVSAPGTYTIVATKTGGCSAVMIGSATVVASNCPNTWTGSVSSDWSVAANWSKGTVPTASEDIVVPVVSSKPYPVLSASVSVNNLDIASGATLSLNGKTFTLTGNLTNTGYIKGSASSSIVLNTSSTPTLYLNPSASDSLLYALTLSGSGGAKLGSGIGIVNLLTVSGGTLNLNGKNLTLKSTSITSTAQLGVVGSGASISGSVTVERYIPKGVKAWRQLSAGGVYGAGSFYANWQEAGKYTAGYGTYITGSKSTTAGINATSGLDNTTNGNPGLYVYPSIATGWTAITNTKTTNIDPYTGYHLGLFGDRTANLYTPNYDSNRNMNNATTLRTKGQLVTGTVTYSTSGVTGNFNSSVTKLASGVNEASFVANPYACMIDWHSVTKTGLTNSYSYFDPTYLTTTGYQVYVTYNTVTGSSNSSLKGNRYLQPGQAFWVQNSNVATSRQLIISETNKVTDNTKLTAIFGKENPFAALSVTLKKNIAGVGNEVMVDAAKLVFDNGFKKGEGEEDSKKIANPKENLSIWDNNTEYAINGLPLPKENETALLKLSNLESGSHYTLEVAAINAPEGLDAYLIDNYLAKQTWIGKEGCTYSFNSTTVTQGSLADRFSIVFKKSTAVASATTAETSSINTVSVYPNPASSFVKLSLTPTEIGNCTIQLVDASGKTALVHKIGHSGGFASYSLPIHVAKGVYTLTIINEKGRSVSKSRLSVQ